MDDQFTITWKAQEIADAFEVSLEEVRIYLTDGRKASFMVERKIQRMHQGWQLAHSEGAGYDLIDPNGGLWEVRSITRNGVYFCSSRDVGSGRSFKEDLFYEKIDLVEGWILADIECFPEVKVYKVDSGNVQKWYEDKLIGKTTSVSRKKFYSHLLGDIDNNV